MTYKGLPYRGPRRSDRVWTRDEILARITPERRERIASVARTRVAGIVPVLECLYDPANVSAIFRSAEALGLLRVLVADAGIPRKLNARKVSRGSEKWLQIERHAGPDEAVASLRAGGFRILVTDADATRTVHDLDLRVPTAFVLGNEHEGVSPRMRELADGTVSIPLRGFTTSLNVGVAAGILLAEARRLRDLAVGQEGDLPPDEREALLERYLQQTVTFSEEGRSSRLPEWVGRLPSPEGAAGKDGPADEPSDAG